MRVRRIPLSNVFSRKINQNGISASNSRSRFYKYDISKGNRKLFLAIKFQNLIKS